MGCNAGVRTNNVAFPPPANRASEDNIVPSLLNDCVEFRITEEQTNKRAVVLTTDQVNGRSNKIAELSSHSAMGVSRPNCGLVNFSQYVSKNLQLASYRTMARNYPRAPRQTSAGKSSRRLCARDRLRSMSFWASTTKRRWEVWWRQSTEHRATHRPFV